ncbi:MAG TPA: malto-oligosyltrehalose trehalohydrolase, partial [Acidobacteriaceae bacterium]|nr:malto-oligosyltrehalose trehalohydrolase [Acidobacteriaceae bacterium]
DATPVLNPLPDPRSARQPDGVHGLSELVDHSAFAWDDDGWRPPALGSGVLYELHVGTFTQDGTLDAAIGRLEYLRELGVTHIQLMPLAAAEGARGWGYDGAALYAPLEAYGGPDAVKRFVNAAHQRGLATLIDVVYNHFGPSGNYTGRFGPYITDHHKTPWGGAVNFEDAGSAEVREFFIENALMWLRDYHFDGLRIDAVHAFIDRSATHFLEQLEEAVRTLGTHTGKQYAVIAESDLNDPRLMTAREAGGYGLDAQWSDDFHHALWTVLTGERTGYYQDFGRMADLAKAIREAFVYQGRYSLYRKRNHGRSIGALPADRFLGYIQNHDQVGNRAQGERLSHVVDSGRAKIGAAMVLLGPFVPMLFAGEEFAASTPFLYFTDFQEKELGRLVSEGRRREFTAFGWTPEEIPDPQAQETFLRSKLRWEELDQGVDDGVHAEMLEWYRRLIALRREEIALTCTELRQVQVSFDEAQRWLRMKRDAIEVVFNAGATAVSLPVLSGQEMQGQVMQGQEMQGQEMQRQEMLLASTPEVVCDAHGLRLPAGSVAILRDLHATDGAPGMAQG